MMISIKQAIVNKGANVCIGRGRTPDGLRGAGLTGGDQWSVCLLEEVGKGEDGIYVALAARLQAHWSAAYARALCGWDSSAREIYLMLTSYSSAR